MYTLDDPRRFTRILELTVPWAHSYADMRPGFTDRERREKYRQAAAARLEPLPSNPLWWAYRISVRKSGRQLDVDNVAKTIIDAFCAAQIIRDGSSYHSLGLYPDDTFDFVRVLQVIGGRSADADRTTIEIFACVKE